MEFVAFSERWWVLQERWGMQSGTETPKTWPSFPLSPPELRDTPVAGADGERVLPPG